MSRIRQPLQVSPLETSVLIGTTYRAALSPQFAPVLSFGMLGIGDTAWMGGPLPRGLGGYGMPGCSLFIEPLLGEIVPSNGWSIPIPNHPGFVATPLWLQAFPFDPGVNAAGAIETNALKLEFGAQ